MRDSPRIFVNTELTDESEFEIGREQAHYLFHVLRKGEGEEVIVFNGRDGEFSAIITQIGKKHGRLKCKEQARAQSALPELTLFFSPIKGHRNDNIIEKATEIGAKFIAPVICERTIVRSANIDKYQGNAIEAAEQCEGLNIPNIEPACNLFDAINNYQGDIVLFADESGGGKNAGEILNNEAKSVALLIGPEGGFSAYERQKLMQIKKVTAFSLGPRILRADTAAITGLALIQSFWGDWCRK